MDEILKSIAEKKARLDALRPLPAEALANLEHYFDIELTYTSNAIEGNTLSAVETTLVIEQGVTIGGKPLRDLDQNRRSLALSSLWNCRLGCAGFS
jgi:Fic family protein